MDDRAGLLPCAAAAPRGTNNSNNLGKREEKTTSAKWLPSMTGGRLPPLLLPAKSSPNNLGLLPTGF